MQFSKKLIVDVRALLWFVTIGGFFLAYLSIQKDYTGALAWITALVGLPWSAHGVICSFYLNMAKAEHTEGGITFEKAKALEFKD